MGTRGAWGFHKDGKTLATYNHFDSYPAGLGREVLRFVRDNDIEDIKKMAGELIPVDACDTPQAEELKALGKYRNSQVNCNADEWYTLLRRVQSDPQAYLDDPDLRAFIDSTSFLEDSLFCEWAYVVNLDEGFLEVYKGFRKEPPKFSRYYDEKTFEPEILPSGRRNKYYPVEQVAAVAFADIKSGRFTEENFDCRTDGIADIEAHPPRRARRLTPGAIGCSIVPNQPDKRITAMSLISEDRYTYLKRFAEFLIECRDGESWRWFERESPSPDKYVVEVEVGAPEAAYWQRPIATLLGIRTEFRRDEGAALLSIRGEPLVKLALLFALYLERHHPGFLGSPVPEKAEATGDPVAILWVTFGRVPVAGIEELYNNPYPEKNED